MVERIHQLKTDQPHRGQLPLPGAARMAASIGVSPFTQPASARFGASRVATDHIAFGRQQADTAEAEATDKADKADKTDQADEVNADKKDKPKPDAKPAAPAKTGIYVDFTLPEYFDEMAKIQTEIHRVNGKNWGTWLNNPAGQIKKQAELKVLWGKQKQVQLKLFKELYRGVNQYLPDPCRTSVKEYLTSPQGFAKDYQDFEHPEKVWCELSTRAGFPINKRFQAITDNLANVDPKELDSKIEELDKQIAGLENELYKLERPPKEDKKEEKRILHEKTEEEKAKYFKEKENAEKRRLRNIELIKEQIQEIQLSKNEFNFIKPMYGVVTKMLDNVPAPPQAFIDQSFEQLKTAYNAKAQPGERLKKLIGPLGSKAGSMRVTMLAETEKGDKRVIKINRPEVVAAIKGMNLAKGHKDNFLERYKDFAEFLFVFKEGRKFENKAREAVDKYINGYKEEVNPYGEQAFSKRFSGHLAKYDKSVRTPNVLYLNANGSVETLMSGSELTGLSRKERCRALQKLGPALVTSLTGIWDTVYADPHSGNVMNTPAILDFGRVGILNEKAHQSVTDLFREFLVRSGYLTKYNYPSAFEDEVFYRGKKDKDNHIVEKEFSTDFLGVTSGYYNNQTGTWEFKIKQTEAFKAIKGLLRTRKNKEVDDKAAQELLWRLFPTNSDEVEDAEKRTAKVIKGNTGKVVPCYINRMLENMVRESEPKKLEPGKEPKLPALIDMSAQGHTISRSDLTHGWEKLSGLMSDYFQYDEGDCSDAAILKELETFSADQVKRLFQFRCPYQESERAWATIDGGSSSREKQRVVKNQIVDLVNYAWSIPQHEWEATSEEKRLEEAKTRLSSVASDKKELEQRFALVSEGKETKDDDEESEDSQDRQAKLETLNIQLEMKMRQKKEAEKALEVAEKKVARSRKLLHDEKHHYQEGLKRLLTEKDHKEALGYLVKLARTQKNLKRLTGQVHDQLFKGSKYNARDQKKAKANLERELYNALEPYTWVDQAAFGLT